jgi:peptidoglycan/xylan/chitin deacetylase (PgdA/CDA1 family)
MASAHGIMFHHFHRPGEPSAQGSITADEFSDLIDFVGRKHILPAQEWFTRAQADRLTPTDICLTFDDNLMCQYEVARPVLDSYGLSCFFFIYSAVCRGKLEPLEIYRVFRNAHFARVQDFYDAFEISVEETLPEVQLCNRMETFSPDEYLKLFPFYSAADKRFRFIRDDVLGRDRYCEVMDAMIIARGLSKLALAKGLWMNDSCLRDLARKGHIIGLHSYSHPTRLSELAPKVQADEYEKNYQHIVEATGIVPIAMSHPCNSYSPATLDLLSELGIKLGFCSNMAPIANRTRFEFPRQDHANIMREMRA